MRIQFFLRIAAVFVFPVALAIMPAHALAQDGDPDDAPASASGDDGDDDLDDDDLDDDDAELEAEKPKASAATVATAPGELKAIVHGLHMATWMGGGYTTGAPVTDDIQGNYTNLSGTEGDGPTAMIGLQLGFDISDNLALELLGGMSFVSNGRTDKVRDLAMTYGGAGVRARLSAFSERLQLTGAGGALFISQYNGVEDADAGPGVLLRVGVEYFVHVRHFSVGVDLMVLLPLAPFHASITAAPFVRYTF